MLVEIVGGIPAPREERGRRRPLAPYDVAGDAAGDVTRDSRSHLRFTLNY